MGTDMTERNVGRVLVCERYEFMATVSARRHSVVCRHIVSLATTAIVDAVCLLMQTDSRAKTVEDSRRERKRKMRMRIGLCRVRFWHFISNFGFGETEASLNWAHSHSIFSFSLPFSLSFSIHFQSCLNEARHRPAEPETETTKICLNFSLALNA